MEIPRRDIQGPWGPPSFLDVEMSWDPLCHSVCFWQLHVYRCSWFIQGICIKCLLGFPAIPFFKKIICF